MFKSLLKATALLICLMAVLWAFFTVLGLVQIGAFVALAGAVGLGLGAALVSFVKWKRKRR